MHALANEERLRLLLVGSTLHIGGAERVIACLAMHLPRARFELTACYLKEKGVVGDEMQRAGVDLLPIPGLVEGRLDRLSFFKLLRLIDRRRIQVVHTHDIHGLMDASACRLLRPSLRHVHTFHYGYPARKYRYGWIERMLWRVPDALVAVGARQAEVIRGLYRIPESRIQVLRNGVDMPIVAFDPRVQDTIANATGPIIGSISTLIEQKGLHHLLQAAAILRGAGHRFLLVIAGDGHLRSELEQLAAALDLQDSVKFLGWVPDASQCLLPVCDVFVQSSLWEAMSVVVLEAMAGGKPVVVTSVGENEHVVVNSRTGLLVPPANPAALAEALLRLLQDSTMRQTLGAAGRERHREHFTVRHMIDAYENLYQRLMRRATAAAA